VRFTFTWVLLAGKVNNQKDCKSMTDEKRRFRYPLHVHLSSAFVLLVLFVGAMVGGMAYLQSKEIIQKLTTDTFERIADEAALNAVQVFSPGETVVDLLAAHNIITSANLEARLGHTDFLLSALERSQDITSVYVGYSDGDFLLVRRIPNDPALRDRFNAPKETAFIAQSIDRGEEQTIGAYVFFRADRSIIAQQNRPDYTAYDPRKRPWFVQAEQTKGQFKTNPYVFFTTQEIGTTLARKALTGGAVVAVDITLQALAKALEKFKVTPGTEVALVSTEGKLVAHPDPGKVLKKTGKDEKPAQATINDLRNLPLQAAFSDFSNNQYKLHVDDREFAGDVWRTMATLVPFSGGSPYILTLAAPTSELLADVTSMMMEAVLWLGITLILILPLSLYFGRLIASPINALVKESKAIQRFDFSQPIEINSVIADVDDLATAMGGMKRTIRQFLDISTAIAGEEDFDHLLDLLVDETIAASKASGGIIYLLNSEETQLIPSVIRGQNRDILPIAIPNLQMSDIGAPIAEAISSGTVSQSVVDPRLEQGEEASGLRRFVQEIDDDECHVVAIPLFNRSRELVGILTLFMTDEVDTSLLSFVSALSGTAAVSIESRQLIEAQKHLFESFIQLIANAIDAKSAYTGGHCERVPQLTKMLAEAAANSNDGAFKDFTLSNDDWEAVHIASWLHDCGKMTTPEFVVDKATKLETIYDRIHEIRMRFEVLKRDAELGYWQGLADGQDAEELKQTLDAELASLDDDFSFIATCNEGSEFIDDAKVERIKTIAERQWRRTLDDRLGISFEERERKEASGAPRSLPVLETLLSDKQEHRLERAERDKISAENPWGFQVHTPKLLYNRGELHNLLIGRGTLAEEERYKINEHIIQTIVMLEKLPFPKHLRHVPEIAGGHHEKMDGTGYPKGLSKEQMSPVARMMAIADVFEALTAVDRPYKKGKTLSEAIRIMSFMRNDNHLDPELFDLFLTSGVYQQYADDFMKPEQIDPVEIGSYLSN